MKNLILITTCLLSLNLSAQTFGFSATNTPALLDPVTRGYIVEMSDDVFWFVFRNDKYTSKAPELDINNMLALGSELKSAGKELKIIYTLNVKSVSISDNFYGFDKMKEYVKVLRIGNECYFEEAGFNKSWDTYLSKNQSLISEAKTKGLPILFSWADPNWIDWNTKAANYINSDPLFFPDLHLYWSSKECSILNTLVDKKLPSEKLTGYSVAKDTFYRNLYTQITTSSFLSDVINNMKALMPNKDIYVTEYGAPVGVGEIGNTFGTEAANDWLINQCKFIPEIKALCKFNLGSATGVITDASKNDLVTGKVKRTGYYSMQMSIKYKEAIPYQFLGEGTFVFSYHNLNRNDVNLTLPDGYYFESFSYECIKAENYYSSSGATAWQMNGSIKSYEISGTKTFDFIPALSYGYITCVVKKIPVYGCVDPLALNYSPEANTDDGSCYFFSDCGCKDKTSLTYSETAPCEDNSKCEYSTVCYKQRWLFKSLGCKVDPKCQINNCK